MFELRGYQNEAVAKCYERIGEGHRPIICAPTGSGKTIIAGDIARREMKQGKRVLFLSGRREILRQTFDIFQDFCGTGNVGFLMAGEKPWWFYPPVIVASWDTVKARWDRSDVWKVPADVVIYDECHLALSPRMCKTIIPHYADEINIGLTATPARQSGRGLGTHFTRIIQVRTVQQIISEGYLAACEYWAGSYADVSGIKTVNGDFENKELSSVMRDGVLIGDVIDNWLRLASDRHTIVFATDIAHAEALTKRFQGAGVNAEVLHSKIPLSTRTAITENFRKQKFQVLVNVGIATYGYDVPSVNCVVLARPTKSIVLHLQTIGRGMRPKPDGDYCMILDHAGNVRRLGTAEDMYRWTLDVNKTAAVNYNRYLDKQDNTDDAYLTTCDACGHMFGRTRICPKCGWEKPLVARDIESVDADLVKIRHARGEATKTDWPDSITTFRMLKGHALTKGYKTGWAAHQYKSKYQNWPAREWNDYGGLEPSKRVKNWILSRQIAYSKKQKSTSMGRKKVGRRGGIKSAMPTPSRRREVSNGYQAAHCHNPESPYVNGYILEGK